MPSTITPTIAHAGTPRGWGARAGRGGLPAARRRDRHEVVVRRSLVAELVLLEQQLGVEPERLRVGPQEAADVRRPGEEVPLLVLERAQVLGTDLRLGLDLRDVDPRAHSRLAEGGADLHSAPQAIRRPRAPRARNPARPPAARARRRPPRSRRRRPAPPARAAHAGGPTR